MNSDDGTLWSKIEDHAIAEYLRTAKGAPAKMVEHIKANKGHVSVCREGTRGMTCCTCGLYVVDDPYATWRGPLPAEARGAIMTHLRIVLPAGDIDVAKVSR